MPHDVAKHDASQPLISIVVPFYNEAGNMNTAHAELSKIAESDPVHRYEYVYVNDGSTDNTLQLLQELAQHDPRVRVVDFTRNFGKEMAITAGICQAAGAAILTIDADGQHPYAAIPAFIDKWQSGAHVVIGVRKNAYRSGWKSLTSRMFYRIFNTYSDTHLVPGSTDFRLIDAAVRDEFMRLGEHNRMSRSLIDWLGFRPEYIYFTMANRQVGAASYSFNKLVQLAVNSFVSLSLKPLYLMMYAGFAVLLLTTLLTVFSASEMLIGDPLGLDISGTAYLVLFALFLLGIILITQGVLALYVSQIHTESKNRPLYVIDRISSRKLLGNSEQ